MDLLLMFLSILLWSHLASSQSWKRRISISLQGGGDYESDDTVKGKELDGSDENEYEYEYLSDETAPNSLSDDDDTKYTPKKQPTDIMSFTFDFYKQMRQFFVQMVKNLDDLIDKIEGEEDISKGFQNGDYGNDRQLTKHEDKGHRLVPVRANRPLKLSRETDCTTPSEQVNCCTKDSPCKLGGGDCDRDLDCEGGLVCGIDNCQDFYPFLKHNGKTSPSKGADCCKVEFDRDLCRANRGKEDDGNCDCDRDEDCYMDEVCGEDNSPHPNPSAPGYDSCIPCSEPGSCPLSAGFTCKLNENNCKGILFCKFHDGGVRFMDRIICTEPYVNCTGITGQDDCCTPDSTCGEGQGACLYDEDCGRNLICGHRNCQDFNSNAQNDFNCCIKKDIVCGKSTTKTVKVEDREWFSFNTQKGEVYESNSKCLVNFELGSSCAGLRFYCHELSMNNEDKEGCTKGDKLEITVTQSKRKETTIYCQDKKPDVKSTGSINVMFKSSGKKMFRSSGKKKRRSSGEKKRKSFCKKKRKSSCKKKRKSSCKKKRKSSCKKKRNSSGKKKRKSSGKKKRKSFGKKKRKPSGKKNRKPSRKKNRKPSWKKNRKPSRKKDQKSDLKKNRTGAKCWVECSVKVKRDWLG